MGLFRCWKWVWWNGCLIIPYHFFHIFYHLSNAFQYPLVSPPTSAPFCLISLAISLAFRMWLSTSLVVSPILPSSSPMAWCGRVPHVVFPPLIQHCQTSFASSALVTFGVIQCLTLLFLNILDHPLMSLIASPIVFSLVVVPLVFM